MSIPKSAIFVIIGLVTIIGSYFVMDLVTGGSLERNLRNVLGRMEVVYLEKYSGYLTDEDYWKVEDPLHRGQLPNQKQISGVGYAKGSTIALPEITGSTGLGDSWNRKFYELGISQTPLNITAKALFVEDSSINYHSQFAPIFHEGIVVFSDASSILKAIDVSSGHLAWKRDTGSRRIAKRGGAVFTKEGKAYLLVGAGEYLKCIRLDDGLDCRDFLGGGVKLSGPTLTPPRVTSEGLVIVATLSPAVDIINLQNGDKINSISLTPEEVDLPPRAGGLPNLYRGGRPWSGLALDEERNLAYLTTSNPAPVLVGYDRPGDNLLSSSLVVLDLERGEVHCSFQDVKHDLWDLDIAAPPVLSRVLKTG